MDEWAGAESWPAVYDEDAPRGSVTDQAAVHLRLARPLSVDREHARELLAAPEIPWLGSRVDYAVGDAGNRRFETNLRLPLRDTASGMVLHKAAYLDLGPAEPAPGGYVWAIGWRSPTLAPLFPVFAGHLALEDGELVLEGYYAPPGGELGIIVDRMLLNVAARRTAQSLLATFWDALASLR